MSTNMNDVFRFASSVWLSLRPAVVCVDVVYFSCLFGSMLKDMSYPISMPANGDVGIGRRIPANSPTKMCSSPNEAYQSPEFAPLQRLCEW